MYNNENSANHYGQQFNSCKNLQVEKSSPTTLCFQIPSELFCCIFEFLTWNEAHSFATRVSMQLYRKLMTEDPCANIYRMFCKRLMECEAKLLLERLDEKNKQHARSLSQLRYSVRKFLKSSSCIFPDLYQLYREPIIAAVDQQALKIEEERQGGITPKKPFIPPKSLLETKSKIEKKKKIEKMCEWKKALQGQLRRHKLLELDILLHQPRQLHWIISTNYNNMRISPEFVQQLGLKIIETFSRIELLSKHTHVIPANILYSEHLKFGSFNYNIFFSFLKLVLDSRMTTNDEKLIEQDGNTWNSQQQQSQNNMFILRMLEFFIEAYFNKFGHYNILIDEPYEGMSALMLIVQLKSPPLLHYVFQKYGTYLLKFQACTTLVPEFSSIVRLATTRLLEQQEYNNNNHSSLNVKTSIRIRARGIFEFNFESYQQRIHQLHHNITSSSYS
ncbi:hypothetical protein C9374_012723 [Naegleria lovaniensis]|uniref:Uncharacterized protein n=1 Tax=Naegleria lovaniensis TaxID=51637 RepID=A0AA88H3Y7_NAELO|nr:uncharacterized protein C9374_012723 [Naegleria lovaniensis]KAG2392471.1 hypothetical protein C9374_012723 [Naegleria lovaniensis]